MSRGDADFPHADELVADAPAPLGGASGQLARVPPLTFLAASAALIYVLVHRLVLSLLAAQKSPLPTLLLLISPFALNLAVAGGLVSFVSGIAEILRSRAVDTARRRVLIGLLSALVGSTLVLSLFAPEGHVMPQHVVVAAAATHMLTLQLAMLSINANRSLAGRTAALLFATTSGFALASLVLRHLNGIDQPPGSGIRGVHGLGELAFLLVPIASAFVVIPWSDAPEARRARRVGFVAVCLMGGVFAAAARLPREVFAQLLYSTLRLEWALDRASLGYALPLSLAVGAAAAATVGPDGRHKQGGAGLCLWLCAGYNPLTPARLLMSALGVMLLSRAVVSLGDESVSPVPPEPKS